MISATLELPAKSLQGIMNNTKLLLRQNRVVLVLSFIFYFTFKFCFQFIVVSVSFQSGFARFSFVFIV